MTDLYIDPIIRRKIITRWVVITLVSLHAWAFMIVLAAVSMDKPPEKLLGDMFSTCTFGIGATLFILLVDKGADFVINKFGTTAPTPTGKVQETVTRTVETTQTDNGGTNVQS